MIATLRNLLLPVWAAAWAFGAEPGIQLEAPQGEQLAIATLTPGTDCVAKQLPAGHWQCIVDNTVQTLELANADTQTPIELTSSFQQEGVNEGTFTYRFDLPSETNVRINFAGAGETLLMLGRCAPAADRTETHQSATGTAARQHSATPLLNTGASASASDTAPLLLIWGVIAAALIVLLMALYVGLVFFGILPHPFGSAMPNNHPALAQADGPGIITVTITTYNRDVRKVYIIGNLLSRSPALTIGKSSSCYIRLKDSSVSGVHCLLCAHEDRLSISPVSGTTELNNEVLAQESITHIHTGDCIRMGDTLLAFSIYR